MYPLQVRFRTTYNGHRMGQATPMVNPVAPTMPSAPTSGPLAAGIIGATLVLALGTVGILFNYGIARESKSRLVKITGYTVAGFGALTTLIGAGGLLLSK